MFANFFFFLGNKLHTLQNLSFTLLLTFTELLFFSCVCVCGMYVKVPKCISAHTCRFMYPRVHMPVEAQSWCQ